MYVCVYEEINLKYHPTKKHTQTTKKKKPPAKIKQSKLCSIYTTL